MNKTQVSGVRAKMRLINPCGIITPETQLQAGAIYSDSTSSSVKPTRLFFGEHTDPESYKLIQSLRRSDRFDSTQTGEFEFTGHFKQVNDYLDERALFVESVKPVTE